MIENYNIKNNPSYVSKDTLPEEGKLIKKDDELTNELNHLYK